MEREPRRAVLGRRAQSGPVGYAGAAFTPATGTYPGIDVVRLALTTVADSGAHPRSTALENLQPLIAAALYETGFCWEAGPLSTWGN